MPKKEPRISMVITSLSLSKGCGLRLRMHLPFMKSSTMQYTWIKIVCVSILELFYTRLFSNVLVYGVPFFVLGPENLHTGLV